MRNYNTLQFTLPILIILLRSRLTNLRSEEPYLFNVVIIATLICKICLFDIRVIGPTLPHLKVTVLLCMFFCRFFVIFQILKDLSAFVNY